MRLHPHSFITESIEVSNYYNYLGPIEHAPNQSDFVGDTVINHPTDPELYARKMPDGRVLKVHPDNVDHVQYSARKAYQISLKTAVDKLDSSFPAYSANEAKHVHHYVVDSSINHRLNAGENIPTMPLDRVISAHRAPDDLVVWSGASPEHSAVLGASNEVLHRSYISTSLSPRSATSFAMKHAKHGDIMKIHVPKDHPCAYVTDPTHEGEREVILPRNTTIHIDRTKEQRMVTPQGSFRVHHCTIV